MSHELERIAAGLVADGKGILAVDETPSTLTKRFDILGIRCTEESRRTYREMLFTTQGAGSLDAGRQALAHRARLNAAAAAGTYTDEMEAAVAGAGSAAHLRVRHDDD